MAPEPWRCTHRIYMRSYINQWHFNFQRLSDQEAKIRYRSLLLKGIIKSVGERHHRRYVRSRQTYPIRKLKPSEQSEADVLLEEITEKILKDKVTNSRQQSWISDNTWKLIDQRIEARQRGRKVNSQSTKGIEQRQKKQVWESRDWDSKQVRQRRHSWDI